MVIILQQSTDGGKRFVSTVVADEETSFNSNFSLNSENSISERSAIYKQRIDSLFGRHTRLSAFKPALKGCNGVTSHRKDDETGGDSSLTEGDKAAGVSCSTESCSSSLLLHFQHTSHSSLSTTSLHSTSVSTTTGSVSPAKNTVSTSSKVFFRQGTQATILLSEEDEIDEEDDHIDPQVREVKVTSNYREGNILEEELTLEEEEEEEDENEQEYERVMDKSCSSIVTDSLNHPTSGNAGHPFAKFYTERTNDRVEQYLAVAHTSECSKQIAPPASTSHVSTVRLNYEDADLEGKNGRRKSPGKPPRKINSPAAMEQKQSMGDNHMWRNGNYGVSPCTAEEKQYGIVRCSPGGILKFGVEYLGSIPVEGNTTALQDLQAPLRSLYLNFLTGTNVMNGELAITSDGLRFEAPKIRLVNPFTTIAVWAAIKFVVKDEAECAFMPLISDPEGQDKSKLYGQMNSELARAYENCVNGLGTFRNPPIFACVMREASFTLDCHAFVCKCAEDAIVIAANLYQSLVDKMRSSSCSSSSSNSSNNNRHDSKGHLHKEGESGYGSLNRNSPANQGSSPTENRSCSSASSQESPNTFNLVCPGMQRSKNQLRESSSSNSSSAEDSAKVHALGIAKANTRGILCNGRDTENKELRVVFSDSESVAPIRPPRRKKKSSGDSGFGNLKRYNSDDSVLIKMPPRRKSFKAAHAPKGIKKRVQISSTPEEITTTASSDQSLNESIDQVLDRIIHPGGMSFNDLKPSYQELLLKIALTLTQDQLYQKSKQAMKKHSQFHLRKKVSNLTNKGSATDSSDENSQFLNVLMKSFSKITSGKNPHSKEGRIGKLPGGGKFKGGKHGKHVSKKKGKTEADSCDPFMSFCSGCLCDKCSEKCYCSLPSKHNIKIIGLPPSAHGGKDACTDIIPEGVITQECGSRKKLCGYDTDSCAESEKCYCSLQRIKANGLKIYNINLDTETSDTDTNSYDFEPFNHDDTSKSCSNLNTVSAKSVEILSYNPQSTTKGRNFNNLSNSPHITTSAVVHFQEPGNHDTQAANENNKAAKNFSVLQPNPSYLHSSSLASQLSPEPGSTLQGNKVLLITGSSPSTRVMYKHPQCSQNRRFHEFGRKQGRSNDFNGSKMDEYSERTRHRRDHGDGSSTDDCNFGPERIISMKKTAEIAAMFSDLKLERGRNHIPELQRHDGSDSSPNTEESGNGSLDLEASLGYLP